MNWLLLFLCFVITSSIEIERTKDKLIFTQIIFRHGNRTILKTYPNDVYKDRIYWPDGFGQLTNAGKQSQYNLGLFLKRRYKSVLGDQFDPEKISVLSSDFDRTINSATVALSAMFPPTEHQIWNTDLLWQPIAVHTIPREMDNLISCDIGCKRYVQALNEYQQTTEVKSLIDENRKLFDYLEKHTGQSIESIDKLKDIQNILDIEKSMNFTLPIWAHEIMQPGDRFEYLANYWLKIITATKQLKRLRSGFLLKDILDRFKKKSNGLLPNQVMQIYSGHEVTISSLLNSIGVFEFHVPPYSAGVLFELYEASSSSRNSANNRHYIQLFYRNTSTDSLSPINIPNCGFKCSLNQFYELYNDILASDYAAECQLSNDRGRANSISITPYIYVIVLPVICLLFMRRKIQ